MSQNIMELRQRIRELEREAEDNIAHVEQLKRDGERRETQVVEAMRQLRTLAWLMEYVAQPNAATEIRHVLAHGGDGHWVTDTFAQLWREHKGEATTDPPMPPHIGEQAWSGDSTPQGSRRKPEPDPSVQAEEVTRWIAERWAARDPIGARFVESLLTTGKHSKDSPGNEEERWPIPHFKRLPARRELELVSCGLCGVVLPSEQTLKHYDWHQEREP